MDAINEEKKEYRSDDGSLGDTYTSIDCLKEKMYIRLNSHTLPPIL